MDVEKLPSGAIRITLIVDQFDHDAIMESVVKRQKLDMPDATHDDANWIGRVLGEVCRGYEELLDRYVRSAPGED